MQFGETSGSNERPIEPFIFYPLSETLLSPAASAATWPELIDDGHFLADSTQRQRISQTLHDELSPQGMITDKTHDAVSEILEQPDYRRLALYIPFSVMVEQPTSSYQRFAQAYREAWRSLLHTHDVRANFVDGDVVEASVQLAEPERVAKAAHLIPQLIKHKIITAGEVSKIRQHTDDDILRDSINETLETQLFPRDSVYQPEPARAVSDRRRAWLDNRRRQADQTSQARAIAHHLYMAESSLDILHDQPPDMAAEVLYEFTCVMAIHGKRQAQTLFAEHILPIAERLDEAGLNRLQRYCRQLDAQGLLDRMRITNPQTRTRDIAQPFSKNILGMSREIASLRRQLKSNAASAFVLPFIILGGSRIKGYGEPDSDIDLAVFVRPEIVETQKTELRARLAQAFPGADPIEYWTRQLPDGRLGIVPLAEPDYHQATDEWSHTIFGGAWLGDPPVVAQAQHDVAIDYFKATEKRSHYLERLEQDTLQYRLMHTGFHRFHSELAPRPVQVDCHSAFWDEAYRRAATRLFADHVFLPRAY